MSSSHNSDAEVVVKESERAGWEGSETSSAEIRWLKETWRIPEGVRCRRPGKESKPILERGERVVFVTHFERSFRVPTIPFFQAFYPSSAFNHTTFPTTPYCRCRHWCPTRKDMLACGLQSSSSPSIPSFGNRASHREQEFAQADDCVRSSHHHSLEGLHLPQDPWTGILPEVAEDVLLCDALGR